MIMKLKKCSKCSIYTFKEKCKKCEDTTCNAHYKFIKINNAPSSKKLKNYLNKID